MELIEAENIEKLASFMHDVWSNWFKYQFNNTNSENEARWISQSNTDYSNLSENDKEKDRVFARKLLQLLKDNENEN